MIMMVILQAHSDREKIIFNMGQLRKPIAKQIIYSSNKNNNKTNESAQIQYLIFCHKKLVFYNFFVYKYFFTKCIKNNLISQY